MNQNGHVLQEKTYTILQQNAINTINDFQQFTVDEFDVMCSEMEKDNKIPFGDRIKLKRVLESASSKDKFVDPEEVEAIEAMKTEINKLKALSTKLNASKTEITAKKEKLSKEINNTFDELVNELRNRQKELLVKLDEIVDAKNKVVTEQNTMLTTNIESYTQDSTKCEKMIRKCVELTEVKARKIQILQIKEDIAKGCAGLAAAFKKNKLNTKLDFFVDKTEIIEYLNRLGGAFVFK